MTFSLDLIAEVADEPLVMEELPEGAAFSAITTIISTLASYACATECLGTAATLVCGPCATSAASAF
jgi:hypothetical protein